MKIGIDLPANLVSRQTCGSVAHVILNSAATRNSLSLAMLAQMKAEFAAIAGDTAIHAVVISGNGPAFCAGHDLKEITAHRADADAGAAFFRRTMAECSSLMQSITALPQPVIAAVEGVATAAGCQLAATCDLAVCGEHAVFCTPGVDIGLFCSTPMVALSRNVPRKHAMRMLLTGDKIGAEEAARFGLVNQVAPAGEAVAAALALAQQIASKPAATIAAGKKAFYAQAGMGMSEAYDYASEVMACNLAGVEAREGIEAFLHKRAPVWPLR